MYQELFKYYDYKLQKKSIRTGQGIFKRAVTHAFFPKKKNIKSGQAIFTVSMKRFYFPLGLVFRG